MQDLGPFRVFHFSTHFIIKKLKTDLTFFSKSGFHNLSKILHIKNFFFIKNTTHHYTGLAYFA